MKQAMSITLTEREQAQLEKWVDAKAHSSHRLVERCRIVLLSADGTSNAEIGRILGVDRQRTRRWRKRWAASAIRLAKAEAKGATNRDYAALMLSVLDDKAGRGCKPTFTAEQISQLIALACESPEDSGLPVTHWTPKELAMVAMERGLFKSISPRHVDRLLKGGRSDPTKASIG